MESRFLKSCDKIAAFDLDHTLLKPKNNKKFPKDKDDAELCYKEIKERFEDLYKNGYKIVIFTNQKNFKRLSKDDIYYKIDTYLPYGRNIDVYISHKEDKYRKPCIGMYDQMVSDNGIINDIFYVGDAAGREGDFSASDAKFAYNAKIKYHTPEEFFLNKIDKIPTIIPLKKPNQKSLKKKIGEKTVVILIGMPATGKSTLTKSLSEKYNDVDIISNDITGSSARSYREFIKAVKADCPRIIVDNTNPSLIGRIQYIEFAKDYGYKVYAIQMGLDYQYAKYLNWYRCYTENTKLIPEIAFRTFKKNYEPIHKNEGYDYVAEYIPKLNKNIFKYSF